MQRRFAFRLFLLSGALAAALATVPATGQTPIGEEQAVHRHLADGDEYELTRWQLLQHGEMLFNARWTVEDGAGRPFSKGTGVPLSDPGEPLFFPRNFNRVSGPDANSCAGCHNLPRAGGSGDIVANVFVLGQRFDHATFDAHDTTPLKSSVDELGNPVTLDTVGNSRATVGMNGAGYVEMLARQMTAELRRIRDSLAPGQSAALETKGVSFGVLSRLADGTWDTSAVEGLPFPSIDTDSGKEAPSLILRPFHQAGAVISLREFTNNAFNHHHGMQTAERFGAGVDADNDGHVDELTRADVTAVTVYQATLPVPGRVIPRDRDVEEAVLLGEQLFGEIGCSSCHIPALPLDDWGWIYTEPNPYNPDNNLQPGDAPELEVNLNSAGLPGPRLREQNGVTWVPLFSDLKLHDITSGPDDPNREPVDMLQPLGSPAFRAGNGHFLTARLWGLANQRPYYHHGKFTTMREAIEAHAGDARDSAAAWRSLDDYGRASIIEFLKTLQVLPEDPPAPILDDEGAGRRWPPGS